jgi:DNA-binding MarR family transcriptional regulator
MQERKTLELLLREVNKAHTNKVNRVLEKYNMHKGQPMLLLALSDHDGLPQSILAKKLVVKPATVSATVKRMEKAGYVVRRRDAEDERISNVYLTDAGRAISSELADQQSDMDELVFEGFSDKEKDQMRNYLERILNNISG